MCAAVPPAGRPTERCMRTGERGFTYLWLLFVLALGGTGIAALGELESTRQQREREAELRFRGEAIAVALGRYAAATPLGHAPLPQQLDDLLADKRALRPQRHLRQLYADPFTGRADWEPVLGQAAVVMAANAESAASAPLATGIVAVRSRSTHRLLATAGQRRTAHDWVFSATDMALSAPAE